MAQIILNKTIVEDSWTLIERDAQLSSETVVASKSIVPLSFLLDNTVLLDSVEDLGVWLDSDEAPEDLEDYLDKIKLIAINFPKFADGRGYSFARTLRDHFKFKGEIRAIGDVLKDQLFYMQRCGFNAFDIRSDRDINDALSSLNDFSNAYQADVHQTAPLFRRRNS